MGAGAQAALRSGSSPQLGAPRVESAVCQGRAAVVELPPPPATGHLRGHGHPEMDSGTGHGKQTTETERERTTDDEIVRKARFRARRAEPRLALEPLDLARAAVEVPDDVPAEQDHRRNTT